MYESIIISPHQRLNCAEMKRLEEREAKLDALEMTGVDNWCGYDDAMAELEEIDDETN